MGALDKVPYRVGDAHQNHFGMELCADTQVKKNRPENVKACVYPKETPNMQ